TSIWSRREQVCKGRRGGPEIAICLLTQSDPIPGCVLMFLRFLSALEMCNCDGEIFERVVSIPRIQRGEWNQRMLRKVRYNLFERGSGCSILVLGKEHRPHGELRISSPGTIPVRRHLLEQRESLLMLSKLHQRTTSAEFGIVAETPVGK